MVDGLSTETNQKSAEIIGNKLFFRKLGAPTEFVFGPYLSNGGGRELADELSLPFGVRTRPSFWLQHSASLRMQNDNENDRRKRQRKGTFRAQNFESRQEMLP